MVHPVNWQFSEEGGDVSTPNQVTLAHPYPLARSCQE